jgi:hypothetical protein
MRLPTHYSGLYSVELHNLDFGDPELLQWGIDRHCY